MRIFGFLKSRFDFFIDKFESLWDWLLWFRFELLSRETLKVMNIDEINRKYTFVYASFAGLLLYFLILFFLRLGFSIFLIIGLLLFLYVNQHFNNLNLKLDWESHKLAHQMPELLNSLDHEAIIWVHYVHPTKEFMILDNIALLIEGFQKIEKSYKVYHVFGKEDFIRIYENEHVTGLWIFGHGKKSGFGYGFKRKDDFLTYSELEKTASKDFIAQFHCNCGGGVSLVEHNQTKNPEKSIVTDYLLTSTRIRYHILMKLQELESDMAKLYSGIQHDTTVIPTLHERGENQPAGRMGNMRGVGT